jgi:mono/diheme cytochrome c family protein
MKNVFSGIAILLFAFLVSFISIASADDTVPAGQKLFLEKKCNTCHSVESAKIEKKMASSKAPDLSDVGSTRDAEWITKWLNKEVELNGKKHMPTWSGTPEEQKTLVDWVASLKTKK